MSIDRETLLGIAQSTGQLVYIGLEPAFYLSSINQLSLMGNTWLPSDFGVQSFETGESGNKRLSFTLGDIDFAWAKRFKAAMTAEPPRSIACEWYLVYGNGHDYQADLKFSGMLETANATRASTVEVAAVVDSSSTALTPRVPFESPHSLAPGEERIFNNTTYRVE